jgi:hypothetical protein
MASQNDVYAATQEQTELVESKTITKGSASQVTAAFGFAALCSAVVAAGTPWFLTNPADAEVFMVFWSALFTFSGVLTGLSLEITRTTAAVTKSSNGPKVALVASVIGLVLAALLAATSSWWGQLVFPAYSGHLALIIAFSVLCCATYHSLVGSLAGLQKWGLYAGLVAADSAARLALVIGTFLLTRSLLWAAAAAGIAFVVWLPFLIVSPTARSTLRTRADAPLRTVLTRFAASALATGSSAVLVIGFPALLSLTAPAAERGSLAPLILALTLTRAPLMIPLNAFQGVAVAHFTKNQSRGFKALWPILRVALLVGVSASIAAHFLGPWLLQLFWGSEYVVSGFVLSALTIGATGLAILTLTGAVCQSLTKHQSFVAGWLTAVVVALVVLMFNIPLELRAVTALVIGPILGIIVHAFALTSKPNSQAINNAT